MNMTQEELWKPIPNTRDMWISNQGNVMSSGKILHGKKDSEGYRRISITDKDKAHSRPRISYLVAEAFVINPDPEHKTYISHIRDDDEGRLDDSADNLEWLTPSEAQRKSALKHKNEKKTNGKTPVIVTDPSGQKKFYESQCAAAEALECSNSEINKAIKGKRKTCHGHKVEYAKKQTDPTMEILNLIFYVLGQINDKLDVITKELI